MDESQKKPSVEAYKGVRDFYPEDQAVQNYLFATMREVAERYGYAEYGASVLEPAELYKAKGAENEEIINDQTYTFTDRGDREVTLRPEMTPTVARMVAARRRELGFPLRLYSIPNVFRYERPQRGRLREHWQLNVDIFGAPAPYAEVEIISVAHGIMTAFGATKDDFTIKINSRRAMDEVFAELNLTHEQANRLRALIDRKNKMPADEFDRGAEAIVGAPFAFPDEEPSDVKEVRAQLSSLGIENTKFDPTIVRGFDYYTGVVFEVYDTHESNNRSLFGGGRYDNLLSLFGDEKIGAIGFGMGDVTMRDFLEARGRLPSYQGAAKLFIATVADELIPYAMQLGDELRKNNVSVEVNVTDRKLADQIKVADKHKVPYLIVVGDNERASQSFTVRDLASGTETSVSREALHTFFLSV